MASEDHDLLIEIHTTVHRIEGRCCDHEDRIREIEAWKNRAVGMVIGAGAVAGAIAAAIYSIVSKLLITR